MHFNIDDLSRPCFIVTRTKNDDEALIFIIFESMCFRVLSTGDRFRLRGHTSAQWNRLREILKQNCGELQLLVRFKGISNERSRLRHPLHTRSWSSSKIIRLDVIVFTPPTPKTLLKFEQHMSDAQSMLVNTHKTSNIVVHIFTPCIITHYAP